MASKTVHRTVRVEVDIERLCVGSLREGFHGGVAQLAGAHLGRVEAVERENSGDQPCGSGDDVIMANIARVENGTNAIIDRDYLAVGRRRDG